MFGEFHHGEKRLFVHSIKDSEAIFDCKKWVFLLWRKSFDTFFGRDKLELELVVGERQKVWRDRIRAEADS